MAESLFDVVGIGNAIVDVIAQADDAFLLRHRLNKGTMTLIDWQQADALYAAMGPAVEVSGGSAANTIAAVCAAEVISHVGARPETSLAELVRQKLG